MIDSKKTMGMALAIAAAGMLGAATPAFSEGTMDAKVQCFGVNDCKGHNDCKTASNSCKGHASCKGQGFVMMTEKMCEEEGGKVQK